VVAERINGPQIGARSRVGYLKQRVRDLYEFRYLVRYLASSALQVERVSFGFGFLWWLLDPILMIALWTFVVVGILARGHGLSGDYPFALFIMAAMLPWQFFVRATRNSVSKTVTQELAMRQIAFPRAVFPLSITFAEAVKLLLAFALFPVAALAFGESLSPVQLLAIPLMPILMAITVGIAWFLSALNFVFRDTERMISILFRLWFFLSPVLYSLYPIGGSVSVPARFRRIYELNPMTFILQCFRDVLLYHVVPPPSAIGGSIAMAIGCLTVGFVFFHVHEPRFARLN
jgi:lipopolysaccharide transport system permease protein